MQIRSAISWSIARPRRTGGQLRLPLVQKCDKLIPRVPDFAFSQTCVILANNPNRASKERLIAGTISHGLEFSIFPLIYGTDSISKRKTGERRESNADKIPFTVTSLLSPLWLSRFLHRPTGILTQKWPRKNLRQPPSVTTLGSWDTAAANSRKKQGCRHYRLQ